MKPKMKVLLGVCLAVTSLLLCSAAMEPLTSHGVEEAFDHALVYVDQNYNQPGLENLEWKASALGPDMVSTTHHMFINKPETVSELQSQFAISPAHSGYMTDQITVIVHAPNDPHLSHIVTIIDSEGHKVWSGKIDVDGHVTEYLRFQ